MAERLELIVARCCPFCGGKAQIEPWPGGGPRKRLVRCSNEDCLVQPGVTGTTRKSALENWNRRPPSYLFKEPTDAR
jgi:hypothetical protein